jgi:hypothetical protein
MEVSFGERTMTAMKKRTGMSLRTRLMLVLAVVLLSDQGGVLAQAALNLCGCAGPGDPPLPAFNAGDPSTYPPGTTGCSSPCTQGTIVIPLPPDGVLKFGSFTVNGTGGGFHIFFGRNAANTPVTILVQGDVVLRNTGCCPSLWVIGDTGSNGTGSTAGVGALGGPGAFRGGDGSALPINGFVVGGAGFGPGGGQGATDTANAAGGTFFGVPELVPLVGGSGGGGGSGFGASANCTGGGGGGGGGALLMAANGTFTMQNYDLNAQGGTGGSVGNGGGCARGGGGGSGGAIRVVAAKFVDLGAARLWANGAGSHFGGGTGTNGRIRLESIDTSAQTQFTTSPAALRVTGPGPLGNPVSPTVAITQVGGQTVAAVPQGYLGSIDVVLGAPGVTGVNVATSGVPSGTTVEIKVKPRVGANPLTSTVPLTACDGSGNCSATATFNLSAGAYVVEARATFQVQ